MWDILLLLIYFFYEFHGLGWIFNELAFNYFGRHICALGIWSLGNQLYNKKKKKGNFSDLVQKLNILNSSSCNIVCFSQTSQNHNSFILDYYVYMAFWMSGWQILVKRMWEVLWWLNNWIMEHLLLTPCSIMAANRPEILLTSEELEICIQ